MGKCSQCGIEFHPDDERKLCLTCEEKLMLIEDMTFNELEAEIATVIAEISDYEGLAQLTPLLEQDLTELQDYLNDLNRQYKRLVARA